MLKIFVHVFALNELKLFTIQLWVMKEGSYTLENEEKEKKFSQSYALNGRAENILAHLFSSQITID